MRKILQQQRKEVFKKMLKLKEGWNEGKEFKGIRCFTEVD
jgi:hypothetical protein